MNKNIQFIKYSVQYEWQFSQQKEGSHQLWNANSVEYMSIDKIYNSLDYGYINTWSSWRFCKISSALLNILVRKVL